MTTPPGTLPSEGFVRIPDGRIGAVSAGMSQMHRCYTIREFCEAHRISRALFYKLSTENLAPKSFHVGHRRLISEEAAAEWRNFMWAKYPATGSLEIQQQVRG